MSTGSTEGRGGTTARITSGGLCCLANTPQNLLSSRFFGEISDRLTTADVLVAVLGDHACTSLLLLLSVLAQRLTGGMAVPMAVD